MHAPRRRLRDDAVDVEGELTIIPYLDILMNLILFMLLSMSGLGLIRVVNASRSTPGDQGAGAAPVSVLIDEHGFTVSSDGEEVTVPRVAGAWDFEALRSTLEAMKPYSQRQLVLRAAPAVAFDVIVETMDAARETKAHAPLLPDVTLVPP